MKAIDLCPPPHLCAEELEGRDVSVVIDSVGFGEVGEEKKTKGIIFFKEHGGRGLVLNRTNLSRIIELHGDDTDQWAGKSITLYPSETELAGKTVDCIRVRPKGHKAKK